MAKNLLFFPINWKCFDDVKTSRMHIDLQIYSSESGPSFQEKRFT